MEWYCLGISTHKPLILVTCLGNFGRLSGKGERNVQWWKTNVQTTYSITHFLFGNRPFLKWWIKLIILTNHQSLWQVSKMPVFGTCTSSWVNAIRPKEILLKKCFKDGQMNMVSFSGMVMFLKHSKGVFALNEIFEGVCIIVQKRIIGTHPSKHLPVGHLQVLMWEKKQLHMTCYWAQQSTTEHEKHNVSNVYRHMTRWWFQICFIFIPTWGDDPTWRAYFSDGLKTPSKWHYSMVYSPSSIGVNPLNLSLNQSPLFTSPPARFPSEKKWPSMALAVQRRHCTWKIVRWNDTPVIWMF